MNKKQQKEILKQVEQAKDMDLLVHFKVMEG